MYCSECKCEFVGNISKCPACKSQLLDEIIPDYEEKKIDYEELVEIIQNNSGEITVELNTSNVTIKTKWEFPYQGYGYAWAKRMQGIYNDLPVVLETNKVNRSKKWKFPYFGYGFAWIKEMAGDIGGNQFLLDSKKVQMERETKFPFRGYGFAWTETMEGTCGDLINIEMITTDVNKVKKWSFPYQGYGMAWEKKTELTATVI